MRASPPTCRSQALLAVVAIDPRLTLGGPPHATGYFPAGYIHLAREAHRFAAVAMVVVGLETMTLAVVLLLVVLALVALRLLRL